MPQHAAVPVLIQSFCITPILAFFNSFWGFSTFAVLVWVWLGGDGRGDGEKVSRAPACRVDLDG
jgi:hypothetical protein